MSISTEVEALFKKNKIEIRLFPDDGIKTFDSFKELRDFIESERDFWANYKDGPKHIHDFFDSTLNSIDRELMSPQRSHLIQDTYLNLQRRLDQTQPMAIYSQTSAGKFLADLYKEDPKASIGAYFYLLKKEKSLNLQEAGILRGVISAFLFDHSEKAILLTKKSEESSLGDLKNDFLEFFNKSKNDYNTSTEKNKNDFENLIKSFKEWQQNTKNSVKGEFETQKETFNQLVQESQSRIDNHEKTYKELLRLKKPADYWKEYKIKYKRLTALWLSLSVVAALALMSALYSILYNFPEAFKLVNDKWSTETIKSTIIFALFVSLGIYLIRLFVKLAISSYHLVVDSDERYQLVHTYLALLDEGKVNEDERKIMIQALFSRVDSGLLKGESSPTMPAVLSNLAGKH